MRGRLVLGLVLVPALAACAKKEKTGPPGPDVTAKPATSADAAAPPAKPAPTMTADMFLAEPPAFTIEALDRGLWITDNGAAPAHKCRMDFAMMLPKVGKIRDAAKAAGASAVSCSAKDAYTVCAYAGGTPETTARWVFGADNDSDETVLLAVELGTPGAWTDLAPVLGTPAPCPRPSDDPQ
jgi:hypothetical protein